MRKLVLTLLLTSAGCAKQTAVPMLCPDLNVTDRLGRELTDSLSARPNEPIELNLAFVPGVIEPSLFPDRPLRKPDEWRFKAELKVDAGKRLGVANPLRQPEEFYGTETAAVQKESSAPGSPVVWISPDFSNVRDAQRIRRWGMVRAPEEPGVYRLSIVAYPTASPRGSNVDVWGDSFVIWNCALHVKEGGEDSRFSTPGRMEISFTPNDPAIKAARRRFGKATRSPTGQ